jgi:hypothetical protein
MSNAADAAAALMEEMEFEGAYFEVGIPERLLGIIALRKVLEAAQRDGRRGIEEELRDTIAALKPRSHELFQASVWDIHWQFHATFATFAKQCISERRLSWAELDASLEQLEREHRQILRPKAYALLDELRKGQPDSRRERERSIREQVERAAASRPALPRHFSDMKAFFEEEWPELEAIVPTNQSAVEFYQLWNLKRHLDHVIAYTFGKDGPFRPSSKVFFGSLGQPLPHAEIRSVPQSDEQLIILSRGLWLATGVASLLVARSTQLEAGLFPIRIELAPAPDLDELVSMLRALLAAERDEAFYTPLEDPAQDSYWEALDFATKGFVFGHEYAHFLYGHFAPEKAPDGKPGRDPWDREYEADAAALDLVLAASTRGASTRLKQIWNSPIPADTRRMIFTLPMVYAATGATLVLDLVEEMEQARGTFAQLREVHPPTVLRIRRVWNLVGHFPQARAVLHATSVAREALRLILDLHEPASQRPWVWRVQAAALSSLWQISHAGLEEMLQRMAGYLRTGSDYAPASGASSPLESQLWHVLADARKDYGPDAVVKQCQQCAAIVRRDALLPARTGPMGNPHDRPEDVKDEPRS